MIDDKEAFAYFGRTVSRPSTDTEFGIRYADRLSHIYIIGKTGTGKTTLLETLISQDIAAGKGVTLIDPHGDYVERLVPHIPTYRKSDLVYFNAPDPKQPYGYNPIGSVPPQYQALVAAGLLETFKKAWHDSWGQRLEHILRNALLALMEQEGASIADILRLLQDKTYRHGVTTNLQNERVRDFWTKEFANYSHRLRAEAIVPIQNKVGAFLASSLMRRILTTPEKPLRLRRLMDHNKILLVNLSRGQIGEDAAQLLGGFLVTAIGLAAYSRANVPEQQRREHFLYVDEFQNFTTLSIANMISELRKYRVGLVLANQYLSQLEVDVRDAVIGNAGTLIAFRVGGKDAPAIAREFDPTFLATDLVNLSNYHIYLRLMIDGAPSRPFSAITLRPKEAEAYALMHRLR